MEWLLTVLVLFALGDASVIPATLSKTSVEDGVPQLECLAGSEWESNCHYCRCSDSGVAECLKQSTCDDGVFIPKKASSFLVDSNLPAGVQCAAGSTWRSGCNVCVCSSTGYKVCSQNHCEDQEKERESNCAPDTAWMHECNRCYCSENGHGFCTQIGCETVTKAPDLPTGKECAVGSTWKSRCNDCVCSEAGYPVCSQRVCESQKEEREQRCALNTKWKDDCNTCYCNGNAYCTQMECDVTDIPRTKECAAGTSWKSSCNDCVCSKDGFAVCSTKPCDDQEKDVSSDAVGKNIPEEDIKAESVSTTKTPANRTCISKAMFIKDCNICWCNDDGTDFFCTRKVCPNLTDLPELPDEVNVDDKPEVPLSRKVRATPAQESPKACQPGQEFRLDCNKCLCDNDGLSFSCTRIDCVALNSAQAHSSDRSKRDTSSASDKPEVSSALVEVKTECTPGSVFQRECNSCTCSQSGQSAQCANAQCTQNHLDSEVHASDSDPGFRCNPGEQFRRDCNDCTCSADGRSYFCTLRFCDDSMRQELSP